MNNSYITIIKEKRTALSRKRVPLNQNECTADFRMGVPFEQNLQQYRFIMECRQSGLTDHQWCVEHDIKPGTFYNWVKRLRQKSRVDLPVSTGRTYRAPESQEVVRVEFHDTDPIPYEQPLNVIPAATERNNFSVAESMKLSVGSFHLTIPNGTDPQLLAQTLRIVKELEC